MIFLSGDYVFRGYCDPSRAMVFSSQLKRARPNTSGPCFAIFPDPDNEELTAEFRNTVNPGDVVHVIYSDDGANRQMIDFAFPLY